MRRYGVVATVLLAFLLVPLPPAAALDGYVQPTSGVLYSGCRDLPVNYSVSFPPEMEDWSLELTAYGADGIEATGAYLGSFGGDPTTGTAGLFFCSIDDPGRYTVVAAGEWYDYDFNTYSYSLPTTSFTMRLPKTKTVAKAKGNFKIKVAVKDERPNGYFPADYYDVWLERRHNGTWKRIPGTKTFTDGPTVYRLPKLRGVKVRAVTPKTDNWTASRSRAVRVSS
jgi:hypothetical protein